MPRVLFYITYELNVKTAAVLLNQIESLYECEENKKKNVIKWFIKKEALYRFRTQALPEAARPRM